MPCANCAPGYVVSDISINAGPIDSFLHLNLHLFHFLVGFVEVARVWSRSLMGMQTQLPFRRILASRESSSQGPQKCQAILRTCCRQLCHSQGGWYSVLYTGSHLMAPEMASNSGVDSWMYWMFW